MKTLNDYGKDVMDAQTRVESIDADIQSTEIALSSLKTDREEAGKALFDAKTALQEAADRVKNGDYGTTDGDVFAFPSMDTQLAGVEDAMRRPAVVSDEDLNRATEDAFEGLNRSPPDDEADTPSTENRSLASNGAGF